MDYLLLICEALWEARYMRFEMELEKASQWSKGSNMSTRNNDRNLPEGFSERC